MNLERAGALARRVVAEVRAENVPFMAGSIAYQAFVSLVPLVALVFVAAAVAGDAALADRVIAMTGSFLPPSAQRLLRNYIVGDVDGGSGVSVIGVVTLVWGTLKIFRGLDTAFSEIYDTEARNSLVDQLKDGLVVLVALGAAFGLAVAATTVFAVLNVPFVGLFTPLLLVVGLSVAFLPMYYRFPDVDVTVRQVVPGVVVAAVGWTVLQSLFQVYVAATGKTSAVDVVGAIVLLLTWLYFSGLVLLVGAVVNAVLAGRREDDSDGAATEATARGASGDATAQTAPDASALADAAERVHAERERLQRERRELETARRELAAERRKGSVDVDELLRENRALARRVRWYEKPAWRRALLRALGRDSRGDADE